MAEGMKPVILHTEESNGWGGQEIRIFNEMLGMKGRGYDVMLAAPPHAALYRKAAASGIRVFPVPMEKTGVLKAAWQVYGIIKRNGVGIVNTHSSRDSWIGSAAGRLAGVRVIRTRHISSKLNNNLATRLVYGSLCDGIFTTGEFIKEQLIRELGLEGEKIYSVPTGIDIEKFASASGDRFREKYGIKPDDVIIGTAAALRSWKGHRYVIRALALLKDEFPKLKAVFAGEGPYRHILEGMAKDSGLEDRVIFTGHIDEVQEAVMALDIAILASFASEGIPQFVLQSMAAGKPVVGTETGGIPEVVRDGVNGCVVPPKDAEALAGAIRRLLLDPADRERMGRGGHGMAVRAHSFGAMLDRIETLYAGICQGGPGRQ